MKTFLLLLLLLAWMPSAQRCRQRQAGAELHMKNVDIMCRRQQ